MPVDSAADVLEEPPASELDGLADDDDVVEVGLLVVVPTMGSPLVDPPSGGGTHWLDSVPAPFPNRRPESQPSSEKLQWPIDSQKPSTPSRWQWLSAAHSNDSSHPSTDSKLASASSAPKPRIGITVPRSNTSENLAAGMARGTLPAMRGLVPSMLSLALLACGEPQPLPADKASYAGTWEGDGVRLKISPTAQVSYDKKKGAGNEHVEGPIAGWREDGFVVGVMTQKTSFDVTAPPHQESGTWTMVINGDTVYRISP